MPDQLTFDDPRTRYPKIHPPVQHQEEPGLSSRMTPVPDLGENSYRGSGRLSGRRALITGGDSGIGAAVAIAFAREGADVAIAHLPVEQPDADHVLETVRAAGRTGMSIPTDVRTEDSCRQLVARAVETLGGLDAIVLCAGKQLVATEVGDLPDEQFVETYEVNVFSLYRIVRAALPHLGPGSTIVSTASLEAYQPAVDRIDYASTKAAVNNLSKGLALQLAPRGIRVNIVAPGPTWTPLQVTDGVQPDELPDYGSETALGRAGQPAELAPVYVFLTSPESSFVIGATYSANGGMPTP